MVFLDVNSKVFFGDFILKFTKPQIVSRIAKGVSNTCISSKASVGWHNNFQDTPKHNIVTVLRVLKFEVLLGSKPRPYA
jgi:hypothetical protein